jgi:hypothetical protein
MVMYTREPGYTFTNEQILQFWLESDGPGGEVLVEICDHASPGIPLKMPIWSGFQLIRLSDGDFLEQVPDATVPHDFGRLIFRGSHLGDAEIVQLVADLVVRWKLEVPVAFANHFDSTKFGDDSKIFEDLRSRFWSTWSGVSDQQCAQIDARLRAENAPYALMVEFLGDPGNPKFRGLLSGATNDGNLGMLYQLAIE